MSVADASSTSSPIVSRKSKYLACGNLLAYILMLFTNYLIASAKTPLAPYSVGKVAGWYRTLINPAGFAFAIWFVIYLLLGAFQVFGFIATWCTRVDVQAKAGGGGSGMQTRTGAGVIDQISGWFIASCVFNILWILLFCQGRPAVFIWLSVFALLGIVFCMANIQMRVKLWRRCLPEGAYQGPLGIGSFLMSRTRICNSSLQSDHKSTKGDGKPAVTFGQNYAGGPPQCDESPELASERALQQQQQDHLTTSSPSVFELIVVDLVFSLYFGWATAASIVNASSAFVASGFTGGQHAHIWAIFMLLIAGTVFTTVVIREGNFSYGFVGTWATVAIFVENLLDGCGQRRHGETTDEMCHQAGYCALIVGISIGILSLVTMWQFFQRISGR